MKKKFNLGPAITFSFKSLRKHPLLIMVPVGIQTIGIVMILLFSDYISKMSIVNASQRSIGLGMFPLMMLGFNAVIYLNLFVQILIQIGITRLGFKIFTEDEKPGWKDLFRLDWSIIWKSIGCSLLLGIYITLAILVCMIPGVILYFVTAKLLLVFRIMIISLVAIPLIFFMFYIPVTYTFLIPTAVDTRDTIDHILQKSGKLVKGVKWSVFGYLFLIYMVSFAISQSSTLLKNHGFDWLYFSVSGICTFLWASLVAMIPIYLYKDLMRQQTQLEVANIPGAIGEDLTQELEEEQAEELVEESPEL